MPKDLAANGSLSEITKSLNNKLASLKLVRSSKNINENLIKESPEISAKTASSNNDKEDDATTDKDKDTVCVQKVMQVCLYLNLK